MTDVDDGSTFYRPLGGGIRFQEPATDAARREIREELDAELAETAVVLAFEELVALEPLYPDGVRDLLQGNTGTPV
jgi:8-oxo-dGTP pyrophosphatase MutT (NUDIX family)